LAMMMALEATLVLEGDTRLARETWKRRAVRYAPFAAMLAGYLAVAYVVNSRSYLVAEGHYRFGWHAVPNILNYIVSLVVWRRGPPAYLVITAAIVALLARGSPRARFFTLWIVATMGPASFFTWGNVSRYLYIPAAGFALLLADLTLRGGDLAARRIPPRAARALILFVACALAVRFAVFAREAADDFRERTRPYERLVEAVRAANPAPPPDGVVYVDRAVADTVPTVYLEPAVQTAFCTADVRAVVR
ncbi:MAG TPA: hypothetical protein VLD67_12835, partial [Vicinamibacterales bacterium]|nr:hypothetical protein [Vicinamibacterales bacterium]